MSRTTVARLLELEMRLAALEEAGGLKFEKGSPMSQFMAEHGDDKVINPDTKNKVKLKSLKGPKGRKLVHRRYEMWKKKKDKALAKGRPRRQTDIKNTSTDILDSLKDEDYLTEHVFSYQDDYDAVKETVTRIQKKKRITNKDEKDVKDLIARNDEVVDVIKNWDDDGSKKRVKFFNELTKKLKSLLPEKS